MDVNGKHAFQASDTFRCAYQKAKTGFSITGEGGRPSSVDLMMIQLLSSGNSITKIESEHQKWEQWDGGGQFVYQIDRSQPSNPIL